MSNIKLSAGTKFSYCVPESHMHEYTTRNFILSMGDGVMNMSYHENECTCKDGWVKNEIPFVLGKVITEKSLKDFLSKSYINMDFDVDSVVITERVFNIQDITIAELIKDYLEAQVEKKENSSFTYPGYGVENSTLLYLMKIVEGTLNNYIVFKNGGSAFDIWLLSTGDINKVIDSFSGNRANYLYAYNFNGNEVILKNIE